MGIRVILDGVFNHVFSDSPFFDRYHHYATVGACESTSSPFRSWFMFHEVGQGNGTCAGAGGSTSASYEGWFGFDSIPVINKRRPPSGVLPDRLRQRRQALAPGRLVRLAHRRVRRPVVPGRLLGDVPRGRQGDQAERADHQRDVAEGLDAAADARGDRLDTTMNYRFRDAVVAFLAPRPSTARASATAGTSIPPSDFLDRLASIREDYPDAAYYSR